MKILFLLLLSIVFNSNIDNIWNSELIMKLITNTMLRVLKLKKTYIRFFMLGQYETNNHVNASLYLGSG